MDCDAIKRELAEARANAYLELSTWWGGPEPGAKGVLITRNDELYDFEYLIFDGNNNYLNKSLLTPSQKEEIDKFLNKHIIGKEIMSDAVFDMGKDIILYNMEGEEERKIANRNELYDELMHIIKK